MKLITRKEWGMREPRRSYSSRVAINRVIIHHTGGKNKLLDDYSGVDSIKSIESHHMDTNGWNAIGYHYLIGANGDIYEGRPDKVIGAHAKGHNTDSIGIMLWGNFELEDPTSEQVKSLVYLLNKLQGKYGILDTGIKGHRDVGATACPGKNLYLLLDSIKLQLFIESGYNSKSDSTATSHNADADADADVIKQLRDSKQLLTKAGELLAKVTATLQRLGDE